MGTIFFHFEYGRKMFYCEQDIILKNVNKNSQDIFVVVNFTLNNFAKMKYCFKDVKTIKPKYFMNIKYKQYK
jgi:hypothetical protein